ncbi:MAG TPA: hypothetical protein PKL11_08350 [Anaerolineaceae bacterium]|nr:hypothetical protein [Anaerolineaceae bacterium]
MKKAGKQYMIRFSISMWIYALVLVLAVLFVNANRESALRFPVMLLPAVPIFFALLAFVNYFQTMDELQKRIQLYALALSVGGTAMIAMTYGLLELVGAPHLSWVWIFPLIVGLWGLGFYIASRRFS